MCEPFAIFPRRLLRAGLSRGEMPVLVCLLSYKGDANEAWPSQTTIAADTGMSVRHVNRTIKSLIQKGMIKANTQEGVRTVYTFPCLDGVAAPAIAENHTAQHLDMVDHAPAPVIAKSATTESVPTQEIPAAPVRTVSDDVPKMETQPPTADNPSPVEQSGNSGMLPEPPASVPPEAKPTQLPAVVMAENAKPHNVSDEFMQELNTRTIVQPKPVDDADLMERARKLAALQAENSARSRAAKLAERGLLNADKPDQDTAAPESALATATPATHATPADNLPPVTKTEERAVKTEELASPVESIAQPAPDAAAPIILPAPVVVHESHDSAPQPALPIIRASQIVTPQQGELLPAKSKRSNAVAVQGELLSEQGNSKGCTLPKDWQLPRSWGVWAMEELGFTEDEVRYQADKFRDHWISTTKNPTKKDWRATWRNWMRKANERGERFTYAPPQQQKSKMTQALDNLVNTNFDWDDQASWNPFYYPTPEDEARKRKKAERNKDVK